MHQLLWWLYAILFGIVALLYYPLLHYFPFPFFLFGTDPRTSEYFEVPKTLFLYVWAAFILLSWSIYCIERKRIEIRRSLFDLPLLLIMISAVISTIFSIDWFSSVFGYPTRLHGGLLSLVVYLLLFWIYFWSGFSESQVKRHIAIVWSTSLLVVVYAILQKAGIDHVGWEQDAQTRVFSTIGQPNWLAAYLSGVWMLGIWLLSTTRSRFIQVLIGMGAVLQILAIIFTGSRSGLLGFVAGLVVLTITGIIWLIHTKRFSARIWVIVAVPLSLLVFYRFTTGASETSDIRMSVWRGSIDVFFHYPLVGSGVETFTYAFYLYRPISLLSTSESAFLYNKAHNELLHVAATTGTVGLLAHLFLQLVFIRAAIGQLKLCLHKSDWRLVMQYASLLGLWVALFVSNFFGFSTVLVWLLMIIAMLLLAQKNRIAIVEIPLKRFFWLPYGCAGIAVYCIYGTQVLMLADHTLAMSKHRSGLDDVLLLQEKSVHLFPFNPWYLSELGFSKALAARVLISDESTRLIVKQFADDATKAIEKSLLIAPNNTIIWRRAAAAYRELYTVDPERFELLLLQASDRVDELAPTDIALREGLIEYYRILGEEEKAKRLEQHLVELQR